MRYGTALHSINRTARCGAEFRNSVPQSNGADFAVAVLDHQKNGFSEGLQCHLPDIEPVLDDCDVAFEPFRTDYPPLLPCFLYGELLHDIALLLHLWNTNLWRDGAKCRINQAAASGASSSSAPPAAPSSRAWRASLSGASSTHLPPARLWHPHTVRGEQCASSHPRARDHGQHPHPVIPIRCEHGEARRTGDRRGRRGASRETAGERARVGDRR
jgi:hypothetical protein